jgi:hypothetical protein
MSKLLLEAIELVITEAIIDMNFYNLLSFAFMDEILERDIKDFEYRLLKTGRVELRGSDGTYSIVEPHELSHYNVSSRKLVKWLESHGAKRMSRR